MSVFFKTSESYSYYLKVKNYSHRTIQSRESSLKNFYQWMESRGIKDPRLVTTEHLHEYREYLEGRGMTLNSVDTWLRGIKTFYDYLEKQNEILLNPFDHFEFKKLGERLPENIPTVEEMKQLLSFPDLTTREGLRNRALLEVLYSTAIRNRECFSLNVEDVDLESGYLRVNEGKGRKDRVIPLGKKACEYLKLYLERVRKEYCKNPDEKSLFLTNGGKRLSGQSINCTVKWIGRRAGLLKPVTTHSFRRAAVTHMMNQGAEVMHLQKMLGHASNGTLKKYIQVTLKEVRETHKKCHPLEKGREK